MMIFQLLLLIVISCTLLHSVECNELPPPCPSKIYCHGDLLNTVQMARIFNDSKTFVDMKLIYSPNETLDKYYKFMNMTGLQPERHETLKFVNENFEPAGSEFEYWLPDDWKAYPSFLDNIQDEHYRKWGAKLNDLWKLLGRKIKKEVKANRELYSIIWVPYPVIVPGGRFREFYYWDTYWIVKGLLLSEMHHTAKGMLDNFMYIVGEYGFIPNGGRIYYTRRSQPPLLIPMVKLYYEYDKKYNMRYVVDNIATMDKEFKYWMTEHTISVEISGKNFTLAVYGDKTSGPRPESYYEDIHSAEIFNSRAEREDHYAELKAAAESGWDFSSRWFITEKKDNDGKLTDLSTRNIIPVDLNSFVYENAVIMSEFHMLMGNETKAKYYDEIAKQWLDAVTAVLWHDDIGAWLDYDIANNKRRNFFYPSNIVPLFNGCYDPVDRDYVVRKVRKYLHVNNVKSYPGGVPTSYLSTGEQWDWPNAWPPLQHMMIMGLDRTGDPYAQQIAFDLADTWVKSNYLAFNETGHMFEKYDSETLGGNGGGGEYEIQVGFGWSNGVIMDLLSKYGEKLQFTTPPPAKLPSDMQFVKTDINAATSSPNTFGQLLTGLLALLVSLTAGFIGAACYKRRGHTSLPDMKTRIMQRNQYTELRNIPQRGVTSR